MTTTRTIFRRTEHQFGGTRTLEHDGASDTFHTLRVAENGSDKHEAYSCEEVGATYFGTTSPEQAVRDYEVYIWGEAYDFGYEVAGAVEDAPFFELDACATRAVNSAVGRVEKLI